VLLLDNMVQIAGKLGRFLWARLARIWWGSLLAIHLPVLWAVWASVITDGPHISRIGSGIALALAIAFFALKLRDVSFLRLRTRQQSFVAVCLLTAIVHHGAVAPAIDEATFAQATVVVAATVAVRSLWRARRALRNGWATLLAALCIRPSTRPAVAFCRSRDVPLRRRFPVRARSAPRAPPA